MALEVFSVADEQKKNIPKPIYQALTKQLIACKAPDEVSCVSITPEKFRSIGYGFNQFLAIVRGGSNMNLFFYPDLFEKEAFIVLQDYYRQFPSSIHAISIADPSDFFNLATKSGCGPSGTPKRNTGPNWTYPDVWSFFTELGISPNGKLRADYPWSSLRADKIKEAFMKIPPQISDIGCAANSAARALLLIGADIDVDYASFESNCPRDVNTILKKQAPWTHILAMIGMAALAPVSGGASIACWGVAAASGIATGLSESDVSPFTSGPSPWELVKYINRYIPSGSPFKEAKVFSYSDFKNCSKAMVSDIMNQEPVIAFIFWGPTSWHYANVIAVNGSREDPKGFMILDTGPAGKDSPENSSIDYRTYASMQHVMYNQYKFNTKFCLGGTPNNYTLIRFVRK